MTAGTRIKVIRPGTDEVSWQRYVDEMKSQRPEQYLAGDLEGYRRGYSDGRKRGNQERVDWQFAGLILALMLAVAGGFLLGMAS